MTRREQREAVLELLFETEFKKDERPEDIFALAVEDRELTLEAGSYIKDVYFDLLDKLDKIDEMIGKCSEGWKTTRLSRLSRSILRLCVYEMLYRKDIPASVSINEAVELSKKFDDPKARSFVNGVLNGVKNLLEGGYQPTGELPAKESKTVGPEEAKKETDGNGTKTEESAGKTEEEVSTDHE